MEIDNLSIGLALQHHNAHGMHKMGLAKPHSAVDEERIVSGARVFRDLQRGGARQLIGFTLDEIIEGKLGAEVDYTADIAAGIGLAAKAGVGRRAGRRGGFHRGDRSGRHRGGARRRADFQRHLCLAVPVDRTDDLTDKRQKAIMDPVEHETVGGEQTQGIAFMYRLQWPYPRVELLWRQFALEVCDAFLPQRAIHASFSHPLTWHSVDLHKSEESLLLAWSYPHPARDPRY